LSAKPDRQARISLHQRIRAEIEERIFSNAWPPGYRIPVEHELMAQFGCSRMTVNKALSTLVATGFLERRRKAGTFIVYPSGHYASLHIPDIRKAILDAGFPYRYRALEVERRAATAEDHRLLKLAAPAEIVEIVSLHYAGERCFAFERRQINLSVVQAAAEVDFHKVPPSIWLLTQVPWSNAEHTIDAVALDPAIAAEMAVAAGVAAMKLSRRTWGAGGTITHADQYFLAGSLTLHASFQIKMDRG
jgi:GntR family histidine utilization transcriptional repressor